MHILCGPLSGLRELGSSPFAAGIFSVGVSMSNKLKLQGVCSVTKAAV